jgi:adenine-specific DNA-methyltransferase
MTRKKSTGAYYTPDYLADFVFSRLGKNMKTRRNISILEPSVGQGSFLFALLKTALYKSKKIYVKALDINKKELNKLKKTDFGNILIDCIHKDFLRFTPPENEKYDLIIGNPPYIKRNLLSANQIRIGTKIHKKSDLSEKTFKNIWSAFFAKSITLLNENGILAFILPSELLQVKYAKELKQLIIDVFKRVEIYTFSDLMFECKGQNTIIIIGYKKHLAEGVYYTHINDIKQTKKNDIILEKNEALQSLDIKWIHHTLDSEDLKLLESIKASLSCVKDYCVSKPGIVTAANNFFIIDSDTEEKYEWLKYTKPILQKGSYVQNRIVFKQSDYDELSSSGKPMKIICLENKDIHKLNIKNKEYLQIGENEDIQNRYKCQLRNHWTIIPNISDPPEGFFFKRSHLFPKLVKNEANVLVTDAAYKIQMYKDYDIDSFIFSFYNSLTLVFSELGGRYYGGGVLELTPNEFKELPIPYLHIRNTAFNKLSHKFQKSKDIKEILDYTDFMLLSSIGLNREKILRIQNIRRILSQKRHRVNNYEIKRGKNLFTI